MSATLRPSVLDLRMRFNLNFCDNHCQAPEYVKRTQQLPQKILRIVEILGIRIMPRSLEVRAQQMWHDKFFRKDKELPGIQL